MNVKTIKRHVMTGISFMVPVVVGAGLCQALGVILGGPDVANSTGLIYYIYKTGNLAMSTMIIPVICAAIAYSIADKPGIAPGLVVGLISAEIKAGFLGGVVGAFLVGYFVNWMKKSIKLPESMKGLMPILIIPFVSSLVCGFLMFTVLGKPIAFIMEALTGFLTSLSTGSKFLYGFCMSAGSAFDFGGPVNKTVSLYTTAMLADGIYEPKACHMVACMIPPMGVLVAWILSKVFKKPIYTNDEKENLKACFPMGVCMITECVIPLAMNDLWRVVLSSVLGGSIAGGLCMMWGVASPVAHGGWFVIPTFTNAGGFVAALALGSVVMGVSLFLLKRRLSAEQVEYGIDVPVEQGEAADINITF
ncbi:MAG: PTS fructose transporter subunit IIC [Lachnospiraceae bacterium]|jgi:PTS system fructose-specific IIC component|nr:PTS fructose transporter subunit IIC [Lachnospiraceae bacterium]